MPGMMLDYYLVWILKFVLYLGICNLELDNRIFAALKSDLWHLI